MPEDRRYDDDEVEEILSVAVRSERAIPDHSSAGRGLTLAELKEIASQAGISPDRIAEAARAVEARGTKLPLQTSLGMRVSVGQVIPLPRRPTDAEWDTLVSDLRDTFAATGEVQDHGKTREWSNGALHFLLESTVDGHQLRATTVNRRYRSLNRMGVVLAVWGLVLLTILVPEALAEGGGVAEALADLLPSILVTAAGVGFIGFSGLSLPKWADEREAQFDAIADRARALLDGPPAHHNER